MKNKLLSLLLVLAMLISMFPMSALADDVTSDAVSYVTLAEKGTLKVVKCPVKVEGNNTIDLALKAAHNSIKTYEGGYASGSVSGFSGTAITKLLNQATTAVSYHLNDTSPSNADASVKADDRIYAWIVSNQNWSDTTNQDVFAYFDKDTAGAKAGGSVEVTLNSEAMKLSPAVKVYKLNDDHTVGTEVTTTATFGTDGKATVTFAENGKYVITAKSGNENIALVAPYCEVTVSENGGSGDSGNTGDTTTKPTLTITIGNVEGVPGETVNVPVTVSYSNFEGKAYGYKFLFGRGENAKFTFGDIKLSDSIDKTEWPSNAAEFMTTDDKDYAYYGQNHKDDISGNGAPIPSGQILEIPVTIGEDAVVGSVYAITFAENSGISTYFNWVGWDNIAPKLQTNYVAGSVKVKQGAEKITLDAPVITKVEAGTKIIKVTPPVASTQDTKATIQYAIAEGDGAYGNWQDSNYFYRKKAGTTYNVIAHYKASDSLKYLDSAASQAYQIKTLTDEEVAAKFSPTSTMTVGSVTAKPGALVEVPITFANNFYGATLTQMHFAVAFIGENIGSNVKIVKQSDTKKYLGKDLLNYTDLMKAFDDGMAELTEISSKNYLDFSPFGISCVLPDGELFKVYVQVAEDAQPGEYNLELEVKNIFGSTNTPNITLSHELYGSKKATITRVPGKVTVTAPSLATPVLSAYTADDDSITVTAPSAVTGATVQYAISADGGVTWGEWQASNKFGNLAEKTEYKVRARYVSADEKSYASEPLTVKTENPKVELIVEKVVASKGATVDVPVTLSHNLKKQANTVVLKPTAPEGLTFKSAKAGAKLPEGWLVSAVGGEVTISGAATDLPNGELVILTYDVSASATDDDYAVTLSENSILNGDDYLRYDVTVTAGKVNVSNHNWAAATYEWSADNTTCTASLKCQDSGCEFNTTPQTETVTATKTETTVSCTTDGKTVYKATFTKAGFATQVKEVKTADKWGHNYVVSCDENGKMSCVCANCQDVDTTYNITVGDTTPVIVVADGKAAAGKTVDVTISVKNNPGLIGAVLNVGYDSDVLELTKAVDAKLLSGGVFGNDVSANPYKLTWAKADTDVTADGVLATLTFKVKANATVNDTAAVAVTYAPANVVNDDLQKVVFGIDNGVITVIESTGGGSTGGGGSSGGGGGGSTTKKDDVTKKDDTKDDTKDDSKKDETGKDNATLPFTDVKSGAWYYDAIKTMYDKGLMNGEGEKEFAPNNKLSRAMLVTILYRLAEQPEVNADALFDDVAAGQWYTKAVAWASNNNIVNGVGDGKFAPNDSITRQELAAMLYRYASAVGLNTTATANLSSFTDSNSVATWAETAMQWAVGTGLIKGDENGALNPTGTATRAEVATVIVRLIEMSVR